MYVQFSDSTEGTIVAYFASPQDSAVYENLGTVEPNDARWVAFYEKINGATPELPAPVSS